MTFSTTEPPTNEAFLCPVCLQVCRVGELVCSACASPLTSTGRTRQLPVPPLKKEEDRVYRPLTAAPQRRLRFEIEGKSWRLPIHETVTLGRCSQGGTSGNPDLDLSPFAAEVKGVSRLHLRLRWRDNLPSVCDLHSTNGTVLNESRLVSGIETPLQDGDELWLGHLQIIVKFE